jgi:hypothetical protein
MGEMFVSVTALPLELHLFPASLLASAPRAGFAEYVKMTGIPMAPPDPPKEDSSLS